MISISNTISKTVWFLNVRSRIHNNLFRNRPNLFIELSSTSDRRNLLQIDMKKEARCPKAQCKGCTLQISTKNYFKTMTKIDFTTMDYYALHIAVLFRENFVQFKLPMYSRSVMLAVHCSGLQFKFQSHL